MRVVHQRLTSQHMLDSLNRNAPPKSLRESKTGVFVEGLVKKDVADAHTAMEVVTNGLKSRRVACTRMNHQSSRAHAVFTLHVEGQVR